MNTSHGSSVFTQPNLELPTFDNLNDDPRRLDRIHKITIYRRSEPSTVAIYRVLGWVTANIAILTKWPLMFWVALLCSLVSFSNQRVTEKSRWHPFFGLGLVITFCTVYVPWIPSLGSWVISEFHNVNEGT
ncbi:hypothetical protein HMI54_001778 [Coelomomyces lativittatus]|nr:hypothetical protein HMI55_004569 [Coelomomyces lativittatus]KAJ1510234.1 hypothetical protein HMI54_001778 [Coelomomyces lativittatus]KAJ1510996.1 hypothetical protein HMI56_005945 [Coelomomyces lativittatus]